MSQSHGVQWAHRAPDASVARASVADDVQRSAEIHTRCLRFESPIRRYAACRGASATRTVSHATATMALYHRKPAAGTAPGTRYLVYRLDPTSRRCLCRPTQPYVWLISVLVFEVRSQVLRN